MEMNNRKVNKMETRLVNKSNQVIISKTLKCGLTKGEHALFDLMKSKVEVNESIIIDDIIEIWTKNVQRQKTYSFHDFNGNLQVYKYGQEHIQQESKQWFKRSLGGLILKAKLVVLPVIDME